MSAVPGRLAVAAAGMVALAVAMGIGRFAFTPLLPLMRAEGSVDLHAASWLASANYLGYLAGALLCTFQPWIWARVRGLPPVDGVRVLRAGLVATGVLTLAMAAPWPAGWPLLRFLAGVASALVFVYTSGWCLSQLAARGAASLGGAIYTGPGIGIVVSGALVGAMNGWHLSAATGWAVFGVLAFALSATVWGIFGSGGIAAPSVVAPAGAAASVAAPAAAAAPAGGSRAEVGWLAFAYGFAGFGYIITATFLPVIARAALPGSPWLDFFWPIFGLGVIIGALVATRIRLQGANRWLLAACYAIQALGIGIGLFLPTLAGFALGSLLLGLPFTAITFFAMQEVRRLRPHAVASTMGLTTALYGLGQIVGPPLTAALLRIAGDEHTGFNLALGIAAGSLVLGAVIYLVIDRVWPLPRR